MNARRRISFSLATLLLLVVIAALIVSHVAMTRQVVDARAELAAARLEVEEVRRKFGHIRVENEKQIFVARVSEREVGTYDAYRIHIPPGHHYFLHLTDATFPTLGNPVDPKPTKTMSMNGWKDGADVVLTCSILKDEGTPRVQVSTQTDSLFDYRMENWIDAPGPSDGWHLKTDPQEAFSPDDTIYVMQWRNYQTKRGIMLWMEPLADYKARLSSE